jgi:hypothetical protein
LHVWLLYTHHSRFATLLYHRPLGIWIEVEWAATRLEPDARAPDDRCRVVALEIEVSLRILGLVAVASVMLFISVPSVANPPPPEEETERIARQPDDQLREPERRRWHEYFLKRALPPRQGRSSTSRSVTQKSQSKKNHPKVSRRGR